MITKFNLADRTIISYAIRKLTPKECFRLMGVNDETISRMQQTETRTRNVLNPETGVKEPKEVEEMIISASQQYRQAGNSIVTNPLVRLYTCMFYPDEICEAGGAWALDPLAADKEAKRMEEEAAKVSKQISFFDVWFS